MAAEAVVVGVRVRPFNDRERGLDAVRCIDMEGPTTLIRNIDTGDEKTFTFDESFWSHDGFEDDGTGYLRPVGNSKYADQRYVFDRFGQRVLDNAWNGFHCCLFAYGQTGAGKSYSMLGYDNNKGIVPISCEEIFRRIGNESDPTKRYEVTVSMIEIYNEAIQDLLIDPSLRPKKGLEVRESKALGIYIDGVVKRPVECYEAIETTIEEATEHRTVGSTLMNATSSRAHTVQIIEFKAIKDGSATVSMINLVDLAGSEKAGQTGATGDRLKEGSHINKSLSALGNVIEKLADRGGEKKKNVLIPYRESKLTRLLQNALGGSSKTIMICALSPASSNHEETLSTLRYADRAKKIKNHAVVNENPQERLMRELREENEKMKKIFQGMAGGVMPDAQAIKEMGAIEQEIAAINAALADQSKSWEEKVAEEKQREAARGRRRSSLRVAETQPMLVNLNEDKTLAGRIRHAFAPGRNTIGGAGRDDSDSESDSDEDSDSSQGSEEPPDAKEDQDDQEEGLPNIELGEGVARNHAVVFAEGDTCFLLAGSQRGAAETFVNGVSLQQVLDDLGVEEEAQICTQKKKPEVPGYKLQHGDRIIFGRQFFVFVVPSEQTADILIASGKVDYAEANHEWQMEQRSTMQRRFSGIHSSMGALPGLGLGLGLGSSVALQLAEKDEVIEAQKAEIAELKSQLAGCKAEAEELRKVAGGRLASSTVAQFLTQEYGLQSQDKEQSDMERISVAIKKTFTDAIENMISVDSLLAKRARKPAQEVEGAAAATVHGSILRRPDPEAPKKEMRVRVGMGIPEAQNRRNLLSPPVR